MPWANTSGCTTAAIVAWNAGIRDRFDLTQMVAFADGESGCQLIPNAAGSPAMGAWQIEWTNGYSASLLLSSWPYNGWAADRLSDHGTNWAPWTGEIFWNCAAGNSCPQSVYAAVDYVFNREPQGP